MQGMFALHITGMIGTRSVRGASGFVLAGNPEVASISGWPLLVHKPSLQFQEADFRARAFRHRLRERREIARK